MKILRDEWPREVIEHVLSQCFDTREAAEEMARQMGPRWHVCKHYRLKGKFQLSHDIGSAL